ncbi:MAG: NADH-quinone oxidoreductase subunit L, partial [Candidatus ainarchaeum sp.]|nr:NADH-quinone oxidoreductase subunit L [Candidatus ainarchaeum sp.]
MNALLALVLFPFFAALAMLAAPEGRARKAAGYASAAVVLGASVFLLYSHFGGGAARYAVEAGLAEEAMLLFEALITAYVIYKGLEAKKYFPVALAVAQAAIVFYLQFGALRGGGAQGSLLLDQLSLAMALITGVVGSLICAYSLDYMGDFHAHRKEVKDRRGAFFFVLFAFLGALFGLVFSAGLAWIYFF